MYVWHDVQKSDYLIEKFWRKGILVLKKSFEEKFWRKDLKKSSEEKYSQHDEVEPNLKKIPHRNGIWGLEANSM